MVRVSGGKKCNFVPIVSSDITVLVIMSFPRVQILNYIEEDTDSLEITRIVY